MMPMHGLIDVDVTNAKRILDTHQPPASLTAFVIASVARAAVRHPEVHAYRNWQGRLVEHSYVDVTTIVEIPTLQGPFPLPHVVRDADIRDVGNITVELRSVKEDPEISTSGKLLERAAPVAARIPGAFRAMYAIMARSLRVRGRTGTVAVTSVSMFAGGGGFAIAPLTLMSLQVVVGGMSQRPRVVEGQVEVRDVLDLTISIDHNVVDGAPAARFGAELREILESAAL